MTGKTIGKYQIVQKLGRGAMGTVYKAVDATLGREVAVKIVNPGTSDPAAAKRFQAEAVTLARLSHPAIATLYEIYEADGDLLMVMELVRGESFDDLLQRSGPQPAERAAYLVAQVLGGLEHAHRAGVVHRDLKPANVMVTEFGGVKIMDFGIAQILGAEHITAHGFALGTPAYMAPERILGKQADARSDLYSLGVLLFRLLTGGLPFTAETAPQLAIRALRDAPQPLTAFRSDLPAWCQQILDRALAKNPAARFQSAESFRAALVASISGIGSEETGLFALPVGLDDVAAAVGAASAPAATAAAVPAAAAPPPSPLLEKTAPVPAVSAMAEAAPPGVPAARGPAAPDAVPSTSKPFPATAVAIGVLAVAVVILGVLVLRRPTIIRVPVPVASQATPPASADPSPPVPTPDAAPPATTASSTVPSAAPASPAPAPSPARGEAPAAGAAATVDEPPARRAAGTTANQPPRAMALSEDTAAGRDGTAAASAANAGRTVPVRPLFQFDGKVVVVDGDKRRERDAIFRLADGALTVLQKPNTPLYHVPLASVVSLTYSNSRQPLWNSPSGPAEAMRVDGGAFGFMSGDRNWFGVRTADALLVLRVDDPLVPKVIAALQERTGLTLERLREPKD